jgi:hypothetical protein
MTALFDTKEYIAEHGKKPRGTKMWAFVPFGFLWGDDMPDGAVAFDFGTFSDAKKMVADRFPHIEVWKVLP